MGATYATRQRFGGRRAKVTDLVVLCCPRHDGKPGTCLRARMVVAISSTTDSPWISDVKHPEQPAKDRIFYDARTQAEIETMPVGTWTWPGATLAAAE